MPTALRDVINPTDSNVQASVFTALAAEALGIIRDRAPEAYDEFIEGLLTCDKRLAPTRARLAIDTLQSAREDLIPILLPSNTPSPTPRHVKVRWAAIGFGAALCLLNAALIGNGVWGTSSALGAPVSYAAYQATLHRP